MKWRMFSEVIFSDMRSCLFSGNLNQLFKRNEEISHIYILRDKTLQDFLECFDSLIPPFRARRSPGNKVGASLFMDQMARRNFLQYSHPLSYLLSNPLSAQYWSTNFHRYVVVACMHATSTWYFIPRN